METNDSILKNTFKAHKITSVWVIDDYYSRPDWDGFIQGNFENEILIKYIISEYPEITIPQDREIKFEVISSYFNLLSEEKKLQLKAEITPSISVNQQDSNLLSELEDWVSKTEAEFKKIPPEEYKNSISNYKKNEKRLILVDLDLNDSQQNFPFKSGEKLLLDLIDQIKGKNGQLYTNKYLFSIFTHAPKADNSQSAFEDQKLRKHYKRGKILLISKTKTNTQSEFAETIQFLSNFRLTSSINKEASKALKHCIKNTLEEIKELSPNVFYHSVIKASKMEGCSENEMLNRIILSEFSNQLQLSIIEKSFHSKSRKLYDNFQQIDLPNPTKIIDDSTRGSVFKIAHSERFESAKIINSLFSPISNGDIFLLNGSQYFILLGQPCDLQLRTPKTAGSQLRKITTARLIKLIDMPENPNSQGQGLSYFSKDGIQKWINYQDVFEVGFDILDLASFNPDGKCLINLKDSLRSFHPSQMALHSNVLNKHETFYDVYMSIINHYATLPQNYQIPKIKNDHLKSIIRENYPNEKFKPERPNNNKKVVEFKLQRVLRLKEPYASYSLMLYTQWLSRPAYPAPFDREN